MNILPFRKKKYSELDVDLDSAASDPDHPLVKEANAYFASRGIKMKDRNVSHALIRKDAEATFRIICMDCLSQFDVFGRLEDARQNADMESTVVQQVMLHQGKCSNRRFPENTTVYQSKLSPNLYGLSVSWRSTEQLPSVITP